MAKYMEKFLDFVYNQLVGYADLMKDDTDRNQRTPHPVMLHRCDDLNSPDFGLHFTLMAINWKVLCEVKVKKLSETVSTPQVTVKEVDLSTELDNYFKPKEVKEVVQIGKDIDIKNVLALIDFKAYSWKDRDNDGEPDIACYTDIPVLKDDYKAVGSVASYIMRMWKDEWADICKTKDKD